MATDFGEKERDFIDGLKENTGRDLSEWMQAIAAAGLTQRNDIIDWLRHKGLMFSKASWLERIHHNGGRPIYADVPKDTAPRRALPRREGTPAPVAASASDAPPVRPAPFLRLVADNPQPAAPAPPPVSTTPPQEPAASPAAAAAPALPTTGDLEALLAKAKAYRPLAQHVLGKIRAASPDAPLSVRDSAVAVGSPTPFAVLGISSKELRLHLALGDHPFDDIVKKGQAGGGLGKGEALSHMLMLNDARQLDARLLDLITRAAAAKG